MGSGAWRLQGRQGFAAGAGLVDYILVAISLSQLDYYALTLCIIVPAGIVVANRPYVRATAPCTVCTRSQAVAFGTRTNSVAAPAQCSRALFCPGYIYSVVY